MSQAPGALATLLSDARQADPANRIDWRDQIAAYGPAAIEAVSPWLKDPSLAAFAIRVIARAGLGGERESAKAALRLARRRLDPRLRADIDWALAVLRPERATVTATVKSGPVVPARIERSRSTSRRPSMPAS
jgi:hypothetical protein